MSAQRSQTRRDVVTGVFALAVSIGYVLQARAIENTLLSDEVGAGGVPTAVGVLLGLTGVILLAKSVVKSRSEVAQTEGEGEDAPQWRAHAMAIALLLVLAVYAWLLPRLGYVISIVAMVAAVTWLAGSRQWRSIAAMAAVSGPLLWVLFDRVLNVRLPSGILGG